jgi:hypothetical protein
MSTGKIILCRDDIAEAADLVASRRGEAQPLSREFSTEVAAVLSAFRECRTAGADSRRAWRAVARAHRKEALPDCLPDSVLRVIHAQAHSFEQHDELIEARIADWTAQAAEWSKRLTLETLQNAPRSASHVAEVWIANLSPSR